MSERRRRRSDTIRDADLVATTRWRRLRRIASLLSGVALLVVVVLLGSTEWLTSLGGRAEGDRLARMERSPEWKDGTFKNSEARRGPRTSMREMLRRQLFGKERRAPAGPVPVVARASRDYATPPAAGLRATWIGWSSVLVEIDGATVLTDPIWSERCSPSALIGPKRFHPPPLALADLPHIDAVLISHDHYDHLDMATVRALSKRGVAFAVPLGVGVHLERWDVPPSQIHELDWNEHVEIAGLTLTATPARHYSGRNPRLMNRTLWASWVVRGPRHRVFYSGDTGFTDHFAKIGAAFGPFDLTLIKIGASDPSWQDIHMSPEEAVQAHRDVNGRVMLPVHWATFNLAYHAWADPVERAVAAARTAGVDIVVPKPGEFVEPGGEPRARAEWWRGL
jgi:L-ascorbate metabolism protein UlaG (beta-lactamase superfamily)